MMPTKENSAGLPAVSFPDLPPLTDYRGVELIEHDQVAARQQGVLGENGKPVLGVAFSGGGIRTATYNLGILQGLVASGLLPRVDYLSTVSGGGFLGTWLHGVIKRHGKGDPRHPSLRNLLTRPEGRPHEAAEDDPIAFLRNYSSYLAPDMGLFSADFWVIAGIWFRNILLNQLILLPFLAAVSLTPLLLGTLAGWYCNSTDNFAMVEMGLSGLAALVLVICAGKGVGSVALDGTSAANDKMTQSEQHTKWDSTPNAVFCAFLLMFVALGMSLASDSLNELKWLSLGEGNAIRLLLGKCLGFTFMFGVLQWQGKFRACFQRRHGTTSKFGWWAYPVIAGTTTALLCFGIMNGLVGLDEKNAGVWHTIAWGPPLLALAMLTGAALHIGLMGVDYEDNAREWLSRMGAHAFIFALGWAGLFAISVFGPYWITALGVYSWAPLAGLGGGWILTSLAGVMAGSSSKTPAKPEEGGGGGGFMSLLSSLAPTIFILGLLLSISLVLHHTVAQMSHVRATVIEADAPPPDNIEVSVKASGAKDVMFNVRNTNKPQPGVLTAAWKTERALLMQKDPDLVEQSVVDFPTRVIAITELLAGVLLMVWYLPRRIDINEFSMHHFYKNRLVRCYLGATNGRDRKPSRLTGFDPCDDILLREFSVKEQYYGPYPLVNCCINLSQGAELAKAERKGSAFLFSPLYTGYDVPGANEDKNTDTQTGGSGELHSVGYRRTEGYGYPDGFHIGTCMGISGAAASPNGGSHTSGPMSFLMTMFSVRMGWWAGNTRRDKPSSKPGPTNSLGALLGELTASTDASSNYVNLSDGGHFENLGLYELVRRRCKYIISGDGEQDGDYTFESLGGAVRKCRTDFGADITIDPRRIRPKDGASRVHCVVGTIRYALRPGQEEKDRETGWLLYLKSSLTGDEPEDVAQYKSSHGDFPQETTANQFFTESQFESYRKLGRHVWEMAFEGVNLEGADVDLEKIFGELYQKWYPPTDLPDGVASRHTDAYTALFRKMSDPVLGQLMDQLIAPAGKPDYVAKGMPQFNPAEERQAFLFTLELVQLMENVWSDLRFTETMQRDSPSNQGWISVFMYWVRQPMFKDAWAKASYTYNQRFQDFYQWVAKKAA